MFNVISGATGAVVNLNADSSSDVTINDSIVDTDGSTSININKSDLKYTGLQNDGSEYVEKTYDITEIGGTYNFNDSVSVRTFNIYNNAKINFGRYEHWNNGNAVITYGNLNVQNFTNDEKGGVLNFVNDHADANTLGNVNLGSDLHTSLDFIITNDGAENWSVTGDTFTSNINAASNGNIVIDNFNINLPVGKTINDITGNFNFQILNNSGSADNLSLVLSSAAQAQLQNDVRLMINNGVYVTGNKTDELTKTTTYLDTFKNYCEEVHGDIYGSIGLTTKNSTNDSIGVVVDHFGEGATITRRDISDLGDTLALVVKGRTSDSDPIVNERSFIAGDAVTSYQVTSDLGEMGGTKLTIKFDDTYDVNKVVTKELTTPEIKWNDDYGAERWTETYKRELTVIGSEAGLSDTLKYKTIQTGETEHIFDPKADNLAIINQYSGAGKEDRKFKFDSAGNEYKVTENTGVTESGKITIEGVAEGETRSTIDYDSHSGFELNNDDTILTLNNVEVKNSSALVTGSAKAGVKVILDNVNIHDNGSGIETAGDIEIKGNSTISDDIQVTGANSKIDIDGTDVVNLNKNIRGIGTSGLNISNGVVNIGENASISAIDTILRDTSLNIANESSLRGLNTTFNGTNNLNISNNRVGTLALGDVNLNGVLRMQVDADLANAQMDKITATSAAIGNGGKIEVSKINLLSPTTQKQIDLLFTDNSDLPGIFRH